MPEVVVLIPAYDPDARLTGLVEALAGRVAHMVVVNDGSRNGTEVFDAIRSKVDAVLVHGENCGKGMALKTGFAWIAANLPGVAGVVTADADGQHLPEDIMRMVEATSHNPDRLVLGVRLLSGDVPLRSRFGNWWARWVFRMVTGFAVSDTQTGLRGIPSALLERVTNLPGERYEFELWMLADARNHPGLPVEVPIRTVYLDGNRSSHYRPFRDTLRTQGAMFLYLYNSLEVPHFFGHENSRTPVNKG